MDIPKISMDLTQNNVMSVVGTQILKMSLDDMQEAGEQLTEMMAEAGTQVMDAGHIDLLT